MRKSTRNMQSSPDYVDQENRRGYLLEAGVMKPLKFRDWLTWEHKVLITLQELQKEVRNDSKDYFNSEHGQLSWQREIVQNATSLFDKVDWSKQYLYQYLCFVPHDIRWFVLFTVMNNMKVIIPWIQDVNYRGYRV